eukprot:TRINITY_DN4853_c0_g1_i2.p2 TRINITY_DN4853_c0_g1~~TRINITY_DN4853_c0_g1_i2.p2  ORF type:complete len:100 (+),score=13.45 TRINITY_DN4853_c0_g1_i2:221-520(+)
MPMAALFIFGPPVVLFLLARTSSCWLVAVPGLIWLCIIVCGWTASELHKLYSYWDGRVALVEEWPAIMAARSLLMGWLFAMSLGIAGIRAFDKTGHCPF